MFVLVFVLLYSCVFIVSLFNVFFVIVCWFIMLSCFPRMFYVLFLFPRIVGGYPVGRQNFVFLFIGLILRK